MKNNELGEILKTEELGKISDKFFQTVSKESDRAIAVLSVIYLDNILEKLIRLVYIKKPNVSSLFKNSQLLQSFHNKISIAYFSGLIRDVVYHDLKLIGEIRNKFAHSIIDDTDFTDKGMSQRIDSLIALPTEIKDIYPPRLKFILVVVHIGTLIRTDIVYFSKYKLPTYVECYNLNSFDYSKAILTPAEIAKIVNTHKE